MKFICILIISLLSACTKPSPNPPTMGQVEDWFNENYELLHELKKIGVQHPSLRRAEPELKKYTDYYGEPSSNDLSAEERVFKIVKQLEIDFVSYSRTYPEFKDLSFMSVPAYRWGLSLGGYSVSIVYVKDLSSIDRILANGHKVKFKALQKNHWYIQESDTR